MAGLASFYAKAVLTWPIGVTRRAIGAIKRSGLARHGKIPGDSQIRAKLHTVEYAPFHPMLADLVTEPAQCGGWAGACELRPAYVM